MSLTKKFPDYKDERRLPKASSHCANFQSKPSAGRRFKPQGTKPPKD